MVAVGMWVALDVMVGSFRRTVDTWVPQTIRVDLYVETVSHREYLNVAELSESMVAVGMWVALDVMVGSFRRKVYTWVTQTIRGDLYVEPVGHREHLGVADLPEILVARVRALPEVRAVDTFRGTRFVHRGRLAFA